MAKLFILSLAGLFNGGHAGACTPVDSCPKLSDGLYCPVNDVTEHADINKDVKEIKTKLKESPVNYAGAKVVYTDGMYSSKGGGVMRKLRSLAQKDMTVGGKYTNSFYSGAVDLHGTTNDIWDNIMIACFDGTGTCQGRSDTFRQYILNKGNIGIVMAYATYEMGAAIWKAANGQTTDVGAPYAWDEAAAFYTGNIAPVIGDGYTGKAPGNLYSPYEFVWKRDKDFPDGTDLHTASIPILNYGLLNCRGTGYNAQNLVSAESALYKVFAITAIRSALKYSWKASEASGAYSDKYHAEGWAYWRSASGYISTVNKTAVQAIDALLDLKLTTIPATTPCMVKTHLESMYAGLGITCAMVGKWKDAPAGSCLDSTCGDMHNSNTLLAGSTSYVDMCKAVAPSPEPSADTAPMAMPLSTISVFAYVATALGSTLV